MYYAMTLGLCLVLAALAPRIGPRTPDLAMFAPAAAVCLMLLVFTRDGYSAQGWRGLGIHRLGVSQWGLALGVPLGVLAFAYGIVWLSGVAAPVKPAGITSVPGFVADVVASIVIVALVAGLAEEVGWRGYLLPHLSGLGVRRAVLWTGALHAFFHLPIILWTPFYHGAGSRLLVVPLFVVTLTAAGVCYGYLRLSTGSVWPAALAHSTFNICWARFNAFSVSSSPETLEYLAGESGVLTVLALALVAAWLGRRLSRFPMVEALPLKPAGN